MGERERGRWGRGERDGGRGEAAIERGREGREGEREIGPAGGRERERR